jgi:hypothetical protein
VKELERKVKGLEELLKEKDLDVEKFKAAASEFNQIKG